MNGNRHIICDCIILIAIMIIFLGILPLLNFFLLGDDSLPAKFTSSQFRNTTKTRKYRKIPKISPGAYIFQRPFLRGLFLEGLIFGGAYKRREVCVSKAARLILGGKFASQNQLGQLKVRRIFMSVVCRKFLLKLALRT